jgi:ABC-type transport system involved in multi-copper enzyme maturation permease subunit
MVGPVFSLELTLGSRRGRHHVFRWIYAGWLLLLLVLCLFVHWITSGASALHGFTRFLIHQQFLVILLVTPTFTAGAITDEKGRGTLQYLLTAGLTSWEIVAGKLLGRTAQVAALLLTGLPVLCFLGVFGGLDPVLFLAMILVSGLALFAIAAGSLLASVWTVETRTAVLAVYATFALAAVALMALGLADFFDPRYVLEPAWGGADLPEFGRRFGLACLAWGGIGTACLALAVGQLRAAYLRQLEGGRPRKERWWRARRPPVGDDPIRWRERELEGIAPLPILRAVPRRLALGAVALLSTAVAVLILVKHLPAGVEPGDLVVMAWQGDVDKLAETYRDMRNPSNQFLLLSLVVLGIATLVVGIRCSGAVSGERERRTWEAVLLTPLETREIIRGKFWGILGSAGGYLTAYAVPTVIFAAIGGLVPLVLTAIFLGVTLLGAFFVAGAGMWCSVTARSSWRSLVGTLAFTYGGATVVGCILFFPITILAMILLIILMLVVRALDQALGSHIAPSLSASAALGYCMVLALWLVLAGIAFCLAWLFLRAAEKRVANRERTRPWKDGFPFERRRRT